MADSIQYPLVFPRGEIPVGNNESQMARPLSLGGLVLALATALVVVGMLMVLSAGASLDRPLWPKNPFQSAAVRQGCFALIGLIAMWITYGLGYRWLRWRYKTVDDLGDSNTAHAQHLLEGNDSFTGSSWWTQPSVWCFLLVIGFLIVALVPGVGSERHGARRWIHFGPEQYGLGFQPSELAKLGVIIFIAAWLAHRQGIMHRFWRGLIPAVMLIGLVDALIILEDLGTAALITLVGGMLILAAGARWWHAGLLAFPGLVGFAGMVVAKPYRMERLTSFQNIWADPLGSGYHAIQSLISIASGGMWGQGLGGGMQKLGYLPEARNDFIFSVICEEMGTVGGWVILGMFLCLTLLGLMILRQAHDPFGKLLAMGITLMIGFQAAMNIAVVTVSVPTKGISLPFISAGGSGVIFYSIAAGLLAAVSRTTVRDTLQNSDS